MPLSRKAWDTKLLEWAENVSLATDNVVLHVKRFRDEELMLRHRNDPRPNFATNPLLKSYEVLEAVYDSYPRKEAPALPPVTFEYEA